jgi:hypothetical protein
MPSMIFPQRLRARSRGGARLCVLGHIAAVQGDPKRTVRQRFLNQKEVPTA